jgi:hypothetical protein
MLGFPCESSQAAVNDSPRSANGVQGVAGSNPAVPIQYELNERPSTRSADVLFRSRAAVGCDLATPCSPRESAPLRLVRLHSPRQERMHHPDDVVDQLAISRRSFDIDGKSISIDDRK